MVQRVDSGTVPCAHFKGHVDQKTFYSRGPGDHFGTLGLHFGGLDHPWSPVGPLWGDLSKKGSIFPQNTRRVWAYVLVVFRPS